MGTKGSWLWGAAAVLAIGLWVTGDGRVFAEQSSDGRQTTNAQPMHTPMHTQEKADAVRTADEDSPPTPQPPCPIPVRGGVICHGPVFPGYPPGSGPRQTIYLPVMHW